MNDEMVDLIEETNDDDDDMENWLYYTRESKEEGDNFDAEQTDQQLIYIDSGDLVISNNDEQQQTFDYEVEDNDMANNVDEEDNVVQVNNGDSQDCDNVNDLSKHTLVLRETIDENGQLVESYFCQQCNIDFNTIEDFLNTHPCMELFNENNEEDQSTDKVKSVTEDKLWDLVENLEEAGDDDVTNEDQVNTEEMTETQPKLEIGTDSLEASNADMELDKERYFCYDCQQVFTDLSSAENHDCINQLPNPNQATEEETSLNSLVVHEEEEQIFRCDLCDKDYSSLRSFNNHKRWHRKAEELLGHTKTLHEVSVVCEVCNTVFASEKNLKLHMKMHKKHTLKTIQEALPVGAQTEYNELNQFFCEICNKSFDQKLLVVHKNMHQNLEEYNCGKCNKQFENLPSYEIHMQMHIDTSSNVNHKTNYKTNFKSFEDIPSTSSQGGVLSEPGKRKHACQYCGKEFQRPYEKVKHERIHTGEKPYECEVCGKSFRVSYSLTLHLRTHTDIRPYVCATCNKRFKQQSVYVHHLKTHVVERDYKCDICGKSFRTSVQLIGHKNIHTKPYNCTECNRPFASLYGVKLHMKTHNKGHKSNKNLKNRCSICGASYARIFALRFHLKEQHGIDVDPGQLLAASNNNTGHQEMDMETAILMNAAQEASEQQMHFISANDEDNDSENDDDSVNDEDDDEVFRHQVDHEENIQNHITQNNYLDETEAATQAILNTQEISVDGFPTEEIITDWLSK